MAGMPEEGVDAVVLNLTAVNTATPAAGYLRVFPPDIAPPAVSSLNFQHGETLSNAVTVRVSADGRIRVRADVGAADVVLDLQGWYSATTRTWTYAYDGDGYRTQRSAPDGTVTGFTWDRSDPVPKLLTQTSDGGERTYLIYGPGGHPYAQITGTEAIYYHRDQLGSTRLLTDASGDPVGLWFWDGYCVRGVNCPWSTPSVAEEWRDSHPETSQHLMNFFGGVLNTITFGNEERISSAMGYAEQVDRCAGWYATGEAVGVATQAAALTTGVTGLGGRGLGAGRGDFLRVSRHQAHEPFPSTFKGGPERRARWLKSHHDFRTHWHVTWRGERYPGGS